MMRFCSLLILSLFSSSAFAHFQLLHVNDYIRDKGGKINILMPFTHPSHGGPMMDMLKPESLSVLNKKKTTDLTDQLSTITWQGTQDSSKAWQAEGKLRGLGDYVFSLTPAPYFEASEDAYIQQFTKTIVNVGGLPTNWHDTLNIAAEIVPDQAPYAIYAGGLFSGVAMADGKPAANIDVEVEYLNHAVNEQNNGFVKQAYVTYPKESLNIITLKTDDQGRFFFGVPHAGYWGFAALGVGKKTEYKGKTLSQDAVLWIQAHALKPIND